jgi:hypothetical protein
MDNQFNVNETANYLNNAISPAFRLSIEKNYYEKINTQAQISQTIKDPLFVNHPLEHISFTNDHGIVHVRDIAVRVLTLIDELNGIHFPKRNAARLEFMKGLGVILAYIHDLGMAEVKNVEEDYHEVIASQTVFQPGFEDNLSLLWEENSGNVAWRITKLAIKKSLPHNSKTVLREILSLCGLHTKKICPITTLNEPLELRKVIQEVIAYPISYQILQQKYNDAENQLRAARAAESNNKQTYEQQKITAEKNLNDFGKPAVNSFLDIFYSDIWKDSFQWLVSDNTEVCELRDDVIDTLRVLRAANASRQRGAKLRATGDHQIFLDHQTAKAVFAVNTHQKMLLLESQNTLLAGEVNLSSTEFTQAGDLRISFYRGTFGDDTAIKRAVFNAAIAINEVQDDMIGSFQHKTGADFTKQFAVSYILLENCDDNPEFSTLVKEQLIILNPELKESIRIVPSLQNATEQERNRYLSSAELKWDLKTENEMLENIANSGHKIIAMKANEAFSHVKCAEIPAGEVLVQAGSPASFVYIPIAEGLVGYPLGGYAPFHVNAFIPLGNVGVIRGDTRNSTIIAEKTVKVLMIPKEVYLKHWHNTYTEQEFSARLKSMDTTTT